MDTEHRHPEITDQKGAETQKTPRGFCEEVFDAELSRAILRVRDAASVGVSGTVQDLRHCQEVL